jgi:two-component system sensor histidine kinase RegB
MLVPAGGAGRVRLRTLLTLRWLAVGGQTVALVAVYFGLGFHFPILPAAAAIGASVCLNITLEVLFPTTKRLTDLEASLYLGYDLVQLAVLLYLTGGLENPFALLIMVPVTISATILGRGSTIGLGVLAVSLISVLAQLHEPLPWARPALVLPPLYVAGIWTALTLGMIFVAVYAWRVAAEARRMSEALTATEMALAREQRLSAVGGLAAAAAHELGTPLGTIAVVAKELAHEFPSDSPLANDLELLQTQVRRCREILSQLSRRPDDAFADRDSPYSVMPFSALIEESAAPYRGGPRPVEIDILADGGEPRVGRSPEIIHALGNLVDNALRYTETEVEILVDWTADRVIVRVRDDGPGFDPEILALLGEPYVTTRDGEGMGLGVFIAKTLLEHTGARVQFANRSPKGAEVAIHWSRSILEVPSVAPRGRPAERPRGERESERTG